jgi:hypothetical protein
LQGKRGIEKQPFQLPDFIAATGIEKIRQVSPYLSHQQFYVLSVSYQAQSVRHVI